MDRERFDALTRLFASRGSRRGAVGALVGMALAGRSSDSSAEPGKGKAKGRGKGRGGGSGNTPGRLPGGGLDPGEPGETGCIARLCPIDPATGKRGFCCTGGWCSCGGRCCSGPDCWVVTTEISGDSPTRAESEHCQPPDGCVPCAGHEGQCCTSCGPVDSSGVQACLSSGPIAGGSIRRR